MDFTGKVALITGGGGGIGRATVLGFAARGAKVVVVDIDEATGQASAELALQRGAEAHFVRADVTRAVDVCSYVQASLEAYGAIDCFFNNAGIEGCIAPTQDYDEAMFDKVISVNLKGVFLGLRHVLPVMLRQGAGTIVNSASITSLFGGAGMPAYVASKHGVLGLTRSLAHRFGPEGIRVNCVCPGYVDTPMLGGALSIDGYRDRLEGRIPMRRLAEPEDIARAVRFLLSAEASYVSGVPLTVDGGTTAGGGQ
jgi:NAD(P)-dependent dehydrogenase (short-subunit alcohol dehydrogenase family)